VVGDRNGSESCCPGRVRREVAGLSGRRNRRRKNFVESISALNICVLSNRSGLVQSKLSIP